MIMAFNCRPCT